MDKEQFIEMLERQHWLRPVEDVLQTAVGETFRLGGEAGKKIEGVLHGDWLGHPVHAAITDVPVGAWTAAAAFDAIEGLTGNTQLQPAADAAIAVGLGGAVVAAVTGLTDWHTLEGNARRVGVIHGFTNIAVFGLYSSSLVARRRQARGWGRVLSSVGFALALGSAWLGGHLVYKYEVGVDEKGHEPEYGKELASNF